MRAGAGYHDTVNPEEGGTELELRDYLRVLRRRLWVVVLAGIVAVGASVALSSVQTPMYAATTELLLKRDPVVFDPSIFIRIDPRRELATELRVVQSRPVRDLVVERIGPAPGVSAQPVGDTDVIRLQVTSPDPDKAAEAANAYAQAYIDFKREQGVNDLFEASAAIQKKLDELDADIARAPERQRASLEQLRSLFEDERQKLLVNADIERGGAQVVGRALVPSEPFSPKVVRNAILALVVGLLVGVGLAFLREYLDDSIKSKDDLERAAGGLPALGLIPALSTWKTKEEARLVSLAEPKSPVTEAYRTLRTAVQFLSLDKPVHAIQVTSPRAQEGKTTTVANLGVVLAQAGLQVVIICCDLRRPRIHEFFGLDNEVGFTSVLLGESPLSQALQPVPDVERLSILASGPLPPNPSELLSSRRTGEVLAPLKAEGRIVLLDSPPVLPVADALVLSRWVDATLVVSGVGKSTRKDISRTVELLSQVEAPLVGTVLNGVRREGGYGYGYYYRRYGYGTYPTTAPTNGAPTENGTRRSGKRKSARSG